MKCTQMKFIFLLVTLSMPYLSFSQQDTIQTSDFAYLTKNVSGKENVHVIFSDPKTHQKKFEGDYFGAAKNGVWLVYNYNNDGTISRQESYSKGIKDGVWFVRTDGHFERKEQYRAGKMVEGHCFDAQGKEVPYFKQPFMYAESMPRPGYDYLEYIDTSLIYPESSKKGRVRGRIIVKFIVEDDGKIQNVSVLKGIDSAMDAEVSRVVASMPPWKPGKNGDEKVPVYFTIPVDIR